MPEGYKHFSKTKPMLLKHRDLVLGWWNKRKEIVNDEGGEKARDFPVQQFLDLNCNFDQCKYPKEEIEVLPPDELIAKCRAERKKVDGWKPPPTPHNRAVSERATAAPDAPERHTRCEML